MINLNKNYAAKLEFQLETPGSAARSATDYFMELGFSFRVAPQTEKVIPKCLSGSIIDVVSYSKPQNFNY